MSATWSDSLRVWEKAGQTQYAGFHSRRETVRIMCVSIPAGQTREAWTDSLREWEKGDSLREWEREYKP